MSALRTVIERIGQYMKVKELRRQMSDVRRWEEERRCVKTKETMQRWLKSPNICTYNTINTTHSIKVIEDGDEHWMEVTEDEEKWKRYWVC